ncbi:mechanosensitive ion channel family protein [Paenibacillaceae bacterium WGS1546]|uniref:mechanosensitive ion channel family protein n=1 Tax=Cohnella sp. WGS1546 TaxID=3366810 RepID=UPI00372D6FB6
MRAWVAAETGATTNNLWNEFVEKMWDMLRDAEMWTSVSVVLGRVLLIFVASRIALMIVSRIIDHATNLKKSERLKLRKRRVQTMSRLLKNTASYSINFITLLLILGEFNVQIMPLLAGAGVIGLAIGFGAQSLVKDVITGFFIIFEDQFAVGDVIQTGSYKGTVEMIGMRATRIRSWTGEIHIIPNGSINEVTNFSVNPQLAVVDVTVSNEQTVDEAMDKLQSVLNQIVDANLTAIPEVLGVQTLTPSQATIRVTAMCKPNTTEEVARVINTEVRKAMDAAKAEA